MTPQEADNALAQVEAQEEQLERQQRLVQKEIKKLENQQLILDQRMQQNEAIEEQLEILQAQPGGQWQGVGAMQQNIPGQVGGVGFQGMGVMERRRPRRSYLLAGVVVIAGLYMLGKSSGGSLHPVAVRATKEGIAFKDWLAQYTGSTRKKFSGVTAEARKAREKEKKEKAALSVKEQELMEKLDSYIEKLEKELEKKGSL